MLQFYTIKHHKHNNLADKAIYKHMHCSQNQQWRALSQEQRGITLQHAAKRKDSPEKCDSMKGIRETEINIQLKNKRQGRVSSSLARSSLAERRTS